MEGNVLCQSVLFAVAAAFLLTFSVGLVGELWRIWRELKDMWRRAGGGK